MPLPMKTLQEASIELGIPEKDLRAMVDLRQIHGVLKKGKLSFAPDELAKAKRLRKTLPESATASAAAAVASQIKPPTPAPARRPNPPKPKRYEM